MRNKVVELKSYRTMVRSSTGIRFPQLYRVYGHFFDLDAETASEQMQPCGKVSEPMYSLVPDDPGTRWAKVDAHPIKGFDPAIDNGWLIIRHHANYEIAEGYCDALFDRFLGDESHFGDYRQTQTDQGFFTLQKRKPSPDAPNHLVIYACKIPDTNPNPIARQWSPGWVDEYQIVLPDGSTTFDSDILYDPNEL